MRLVTCSNDRHAQPWVGLIVEGERVVNVSAASGAPFDSSIMLGLLDAGPDGSAWLRDLERRGEASVPLEGLHLWAPIPRPRKNVFCVGWNYVEHFREGEKTRTAALDLPDHPTFFTKAPTAVNGPRDAIPIDASITEKLDWEVELAVVIGKRGRSIAEADAMAYVWGYTVLNDVTGRDIQRRHGQQWFKGKSLDGSCPMGPWLVSADALDPQALRIACWVNGVLKQESSTEYMHFRIPRIIAELSHGLTLEPGDIIATGTPPGVGHARVPPEFLHEGDVLESEIEGIGRLRNVVGTGTQTSGVRS
jgi:2-keto-4-pentenoate hydratase/2-oxohepta-3-ene-1,7-dioic acid hydratase in catechol pathway